MSEQHNPAAFPSQLREARDPGDHDPEAGMTLRDWFAGQVLPALAAFGPKGHAPQDLVAEAAYTYADAMLAERAKGGAA